MRDAEILTEEKQEKDQAALHQAKTAISQQDNILNSIVVGLVGGTNRPHHSHQQDHQRRPAEEDDAQVAQGLVGAEGVLEDFLKNREGKQNAEADIHVISVVVDLVGQIDIDEGQNRNRDHLQNRVVEEEWVITVESAPEHAYQYARLEERRSKPEQVVDEM